MTIREEFRAYLKESELNEASRFDKKKERNIQSY